jgi:hypothetical protein
MMRLTVATLLKKTRSAALPDSVRVPLRLPHVTPVPIGTNAPTHI